MNIYTRAIATESKFAKTIDVVQALNTYAYCKDNTSEIFLNMIENKYLNLASSINTITNNNLSVLIIPYDNYYITYVDGIMLNNYYDDVYGQFYKFYNYNDITYIKIKSDMKGPEDGALEITPLSNTKNQECMIQHTMYVDDTNNNERISDPTFKLIFDSISEIYQEPDSMPKIYPESSTRNII